jgi:hypothetical protein
VAFVKRFGRIRKTRFLKKIIHMGLEIQKKKCRDELFCLDYKKNIKSRYSFFILGNFLRISSVVGGYKKIK